MPTVDVSGRELSYVRRGTGSEPLLLIQGMSGNHLAWGEQFLSELEADFDLITYDHRGVGLSAWVTEPFTLADLADDAVGLLDALDVETAHVLGISMGGMVAQELVLRHPQRLRTLTLGCTYAGGPGSRLTAPEVVQLISESALSGDRDWAIRVGFEVNLSDRFRADASRFAPFRDMVMTYPTAVQVILLQAQAIQGHDTSARLGEIAAPTLVVHGTEDRVLDVSNGELIATQIPGARLEILDGVGHMFWWEEPERSAELVREHAGAPARAQ